MGTLLTLTTWYRDYTDKNSTVLSDARCDEFAAAAQERLEQAHRWRGMEASYDFTYGNTDDGKAVPTGFISELIVSQEDSSQQPANSLTPLKKVEGGRIAWLLSRVQEGERDQYYPQIAAVSLTTIDDAYYYIWAEKIYIVPQPQSTTNYQIDYYGKVTALERGVTDSNWFTANYHNLMKWGGLVEAWSFLHEPQRAADAEAIFAQMLTRAIAHDRSIAMSGPPRGRGT